MTQQTPTSINIDFLQRLIQEGANLLSQKTFHNGQFNDYYLVDNSTYRSWQLKTLNYLQRTLTDKNHYYIGFKNQLSTHGYDTDVQLGIKIIKSLTDDVQANVFDSLPQVVDALHDLQFLSDRFHKFAIHLRSRHNERATLDISDEYDVQDLLHALLRLYFDDIEHEDYISKLGGVGSRLDFALREHGIIIEVKMTRDKLRNKGLGEELIVDAARYKSYAGLKHLYCFVYDPGGYIKNPRGFEKDFSKSHDGINVIVVIRPII